MADSKARQELREYRQYLKNKQEQGLEITLEENDYLDELYAKADMIEDIGLVDYDPSTFPPRE